MVCPQSQVMQSGTGEIWGCGIRMLARAPRYRRSIFRDQYALLVLFVRLRIAAFFYLPLSSGIRA